MKTGKYFLATLFVILAIFTQGWRNGQLPHTGNPVVYGCDAPTCHGGVLPDGELLITSLLGPTWQAGSNVISVQPIVAVDTLGGGFSGDSTFSTWNYIMNFTRCNGQPLPITVGAHSCISGTERRYQANGIWYVEIGNSPELRWMSIAGRPANLMHLTHYCLAQFQITNTSFDDSIKVNVCAVFGQGDTIPGNDSTVCTSLKLAHSGAFDTSPQIDGLSVPNNTYVNILTVGNGGVSIHHTGAWRIVSLIGTEIKGIGVKFLSLSPGLYYFSTDLGVTKKIIIR